MSYKSIWIIFLPILFLTSCLDDECVSTREYKIYDSVNLHVDEFRKSQIPVLKEQTLENPGKLYFYNNMLLINEQGRGIHFYDISDLKNVDYVAFYDIPGNFDMAIHNDILFADNVIDLISIDIKDISNPKLLHRVENYRDDYTSENQVYHAYSIATDRIEVIDCSDQDFGREEFWRNGQFFTTGFSAEVIQTAATSSAQGGSGTGGSFARFTIANNHLYTVSHTDLTSWAINGGNVTKSSTNNLGWGIETIFPYGDYLFIGSNSGMYIYDNTDPTAPSQMSVFEHARACDPVVANETHAYVTLRNGSECAGFINQMDVVDITDLKSPKLVKSYPMKNPHGLALLGDRVFLCEGSHGMKLLDVSDPAKVKEVDYMEDMKTYDVIALPSADILIVGEDGFYLATYENDKLMIQSSIKAEKQ